MNIRLFIVIPIGGLVGYLAAHYLYPLIGLWFIIPCIVAGVLIGYFGNALLHRLGIK